MSATTSARGYDWTAARTVDLWRWHVEDLETADVFAASNNLAAVNDHVARAAAKLEAIERKLEGAHIEPLPWGSCWRNRNRFGVPDAERIYGSVYLARHPEMQEGS